MSIDAQVQMVLDAVSIPHGGIPASLDYIAQVARQVHEQDMFYDTTFDKGNAFLFAFAAYGMLSLSQDASHRFLARDLVNGLNGAYQLLPGYNDFSEMASAVIDAERTKMEPYSPQVSPEPASRRHLISRAVQGNIYYEGNQIYHTFRKDRFFGPLVPVPA